MLRQVAIGVIVFTVAAACLGSAPSYDQTHSAAQIVGDASTALTAARSYHLVLEAMGTSGGAASIELDVEGGNYRGMLVLGGQSLRTVVFQGEDYIYGSDLAASIQLTDPQVAAVILAKAKDRWVHMPPGSDTRLTTIFDVNGLGDCLQHAAGLVKKGTAKVDQEPVVEVDDLAGSRFYIAIAAPHYPLRLSFTTAEACLESYVTSETVDLSQFGTKYNLEAPPGFIDLTVLVGG